MIVSTTYRFTFSLLSSSFFSWSQPVHLSLLCGHLWAQTKGALKGPVRNHHYQTLSWRAPTTWLECLRRWIFTKEAINTKCQTSYRTQSLNTSNVGPSSNQYLIHEQIRAIQVRQPYHTVMPSLLLVLANLIPKAHAVLSFNLFVWWFPLLWLPRLKQEQILSLNQKLAAYREMECHGQIPHHYLYEYEPNERFCSFRRKAEGLVFWFGPTRPSPLHRQVGSEIRALFLDGSSSRGASCGTSVFLPRCGTSVPTKKPGKWTVSSVRFSCFEISFYWVLSYSCLFTSSCYEISTIQ